MGSVIGHVGSRVGALVDGQLPADESERLWVHVHSCRRCRASVEREGWVKMQLAGLASSWPASAPLGLRQGLAAPAPAAPAAPAPPTAPSRSAADHRGLVTVAVLGAGSIGAAMVGVIALSVTATGPDPARRVTTSFETTTISTVPARARTTEP